MAKITPEYTFIDGDTMYQRFFSDGPRSNRDLFDRIKYLNVSEMQKEDHFVCHTAEGKIIADLAIQQSPYETDVIWLKHVSVDPKYRNQGIASELMRRCFEHMSNEGKTLELSSLSEEGKAYLPALIRRLRSEYPEVEVLKSYMDEGVDFTPNPAP